MRLCYTSFKYTFLALYFFASNLFLAIYFIFILDCWNDVRQKAKMSSFLIQFYKCIIRQQCQLTTSTTHLTQELLTEVQCSGGSRSFAKKTRTLKTKSVVAGHWKLSVTNWEPSLKLILLQLHEKLPKNSASTILRSLLEQIHLKQIGKVKKLDK